MGGGFGGDGGGGAGDPGAAPVDNSLNTDILQGERGGNGYSVTAMGFDDNGGFTGYSTVTDIAGADAGNLLDLMKEESHSAYEAIFGRKKPGNLQPRTIMSIIDERNKRGIGNKHENIFELHSETYRVMCLDKVFFSCLPNYENFNYYRHSEWVKNSFIVRLKECNHKCGKEEEEIAIDEIIRREKFLTKYYKGNYKTLFNLEAYRKGQPLPTLIGFCSSVDRSAQCEEKYKRFVYIGAPKEEDRNPASKRNSGSKQSLVPKLNLNQK
jgi:hypothetical protein